MLLSLLYFLMLRKLCAYKEIEILGRKHAKITFTCC